MDWFLLEYDAVLIQPKITYPKNADMLNFLLNLNFVRSYWSFNVRMDYNAKINVFVIHVKFSQ